MINPLSGMLSNPSSSSRYAEEATRRNAAAADTQAAADSGSDEGYTESTTTETDALASKQTFLTLLVAQIKNQNPLNPTDGTEFLSQLAQFSELEQLISIRQELEAIGQAGTGIGGDGETGD